MDEAKYSVKATAELTGLPPDTLRTWERRYGAVTPHRDASGRRYYDPDHIERLQLLRRLTDQGHAIRHIATMDVGGLRSLASEERPGGGHEAFKGLISTLMASVTAGENHRLEQQLGLAAASLAPKVFALNVLVPFLDSVGEGWRANEVSIAREHMASAVVRDLLGNLIRTLPVPNGPVRAVLATLPGERHEFGLLMAYYVTKAAGANCHYLGVDLPPAEIAGACRALEAPVAALSAVVAASHADPGRHLRELRDALPDYAVIWVGGRAAEDVIERAPGVDARPMKSYDRFLLELESG